MSIHPDTKPMTPEELAERIRDLTTFDHDGGEDGYSTAADAMWKVALVAFNYAADQVGPTGFQASWAALKFYGEALSIEGPFMVVQVHDALYPQYDVLGRVARFLGEQQEWLAEQAAEKLAQYEAKPTLTYTDDDGNEVTAPNVHPDVVAHWRRLCEPVPA